MRKKIVSVFMSVALMAGGMAYAQSPTDGATGATSKNNQSECCQDGKKADKKKGDKKKDKNKGDKKAGKHNGKVLAEARFNPFDGIQLTDDQQQRLQVLQQGLGPVMLDKKEQADIPVNPQLTPEQKKQLKEEKKAKKLEAKKNYLNGVKEVLTPEQYVIFLENVYLYAPNGGGSKGVKPGSKGKFHGGAKGSKVKKVTSAN